MKSFSPSSGFRNVWSLEYLFEYWEKKEQDSNPVIAGLARTIKAIAVAHPELVGALSDPAVIEKNQDVLAPLWSTIIPATTIETEIIAISLPFEMTPVYATKPYLEMMAVKSDHHHHDVKTSHQILLSTWRFV